MGQQKLNAHLLTAADLQKFRKRVEIDAAKCGHPELADDFVSDYFLSLAKGWRQTARQSVGDSLRAIYGRSGQPGYAERVAEVRSHVSIDAEVETKNGRVPLREILACPDGDAGSERGVGAIVDRCRALTDRERQIVVMYFERDLKLYEIGAHFGVSESRISQQLGSALLKLKRVTKNPFAGKRKANTVETKPILTQPEAAKQEALSVAQIAAITNKSPSSLYYRANKITPVVARSRRDGGNLYHLSQFQAPTKRAGRPPALPVSSNCHSVNARVKQNSKPAQASALVSRAQWFFIGAAVASWLAAIVAIVANRAI